MADSSITTSGALAWVRDTFRTRGFFGAVGYYAGGTVELLRDLTPTRRKSRYGDIDYDFDHGVDTTWATLPLRTRVRELLSGGQYQPSEPALFHDILRSIPGPLDGFTFIDLGSGKGRALLMASDYPFRRIVGVEILSELHTIAERNINRYHCDRQQCFALESHALDAREFVFPAEPTLLYLFNPFPAAVLKTVLAGLHTSVLASPRPVFLLYHNLVHDEVFREQTWLEALHRTHQFVLYRARNCD